MRHKVGKHGSKDCEAVLDDTEPVELVTDEARELGVTELELRVEELVVSVSVVVGIPFDSDELPRP